VPHFYGDVLLTRLVKPKLEQACATHLPGSSLHLGAMHYDVWHDRLACDSAALIRSDGAPASTGAMAVTGVHWARLLLGQRSPAQLFNRTQFDVTDLSAALPGAEYRVECRHLRISVPESVCIAQAVTLHVAGSDEAFFAALPFRRLRYRLEIASCALRGVDFAALLSGQAYRAQSLELAGPKIETLINREKPRHPVPNPPLPHTALAAISKPFRLDRLTITDGEIRLAARRFVGAEPGVLTFTAVQIGAQEIANAAAGGEAITLAAEGRLMDAGTLSVQLHLPVAPAALAFHYAGNLSAMDLTRLDEYMEGTGRVQIQSGRVNEATFDIDVVDGHARGVVRGEYRDLRVTVVNGETGRRQGVANRVETLLTNALRVRNDNIPAQAGASKAGKVDYVRKPEESFLQFAWLALRGGLLDLVSMQASPIP
jgi:hypothetical protein